ncbi:DUF1848 domain-containing protein [Desulfobotulus sp. H1]|uniref:DUF1848 domain-containing protein n=1 Tax=Desulfobotulus pelophilus TaxID=2823377 RepID=A0ABT3N6V5_9BACT|nr:DUF1848 family protein [Desulfobotulus pelophilus]MCW7753184.1 DUF1848 domain-containing protein [Desulfobotulus pelophilus]
MTRRRILSVSRRTDIPAFHLDWFHEGLAKGYCEPVNPVSQKTFRVPTDPDAVAAFVFWSKNYGPFLQKQTAKILKERGQKFHLQFTINSPIPQLEPSLPPLAARLEQMAELARCFGPERISWRWDPICHWIDILGKRHHNLNDFMTIASAAAEAGITSCTTGFLDLYAKVNQKGQRRGITFFDPGQSRKKAILERMAVRLRSMGMNLLLCCEPDMLALCNGDNIFPAQCVVQAADFPSLNLPKDKGQRAACNCRLSTDIGSYRTQPCSHGCLYCYAQ